MLLKFLQQKTKPRRRFLRKASLQPGLGHLWQRTLQLQYLFLTLECADQQQINRRSQLSKKLRMKRIGRSRGINLLLNKASVSNYYICIFLFLCSMCIFLVLKCPVTLSNDLMLLQAQLALRLQRKHSMRTKKMRSLPNFSFLIPKTNMFIASASGLLCFFVLFSRVVIDSLLWVFCRMLPQWRRSVWLKSHKHITQEAKSCWVCLQYFFFCGGFLCIEDFRWKFSVCLVKPFYLRVLGLFNCWWFRL